jgi:hypothetical protein
MKRQSGKGRCSPWRGVLRAPSQGTIEPSEGLRYIAQSSSSYNPDLRRPYISEIDVPSLETY